ncbi:MAG TPA: MarR family transcriptional regulator [Nocardioides sp.]|nr:MarR family transcriptional regulator [Nocardioides sp.]
MSKAQRSRRRTQLLASLQQAGREQSNAAVMFHTAVAAHMGLSATDEKILDLLERHGPLSAGQLVEHTGLAPSSITAAVDRLERNGFVDRARDDVDKRRVTVVLRQDRLAEAQPLFADLARRLKRVYDGYSDDDLAVVLRFMEESTAAQHAATEKLTQAQDR